MMWYRYLDRLSCGMVLENRAAVPVFCWYIDLVTFLLRLPWWHVLPFVAVTVYAFTTIYGLSCSYLFCSPGQRVGRKTWLPVADDMYSIITNDKEKTRRGQHYPPDGSILCDLLCTFKQCLNLLYAMCMLSRFARAARISVTEEGTPYRYDVFVFAIR